MLSQIHEHPDQPTSRERIAPNLMDTPKTIWNRVTNFAHIIQHLLQTTPNWLKRLVGVVAHSSGLVVLAILFLLAYQQRQVLMEALDIKPVYLIPLTGCYVIGFGLAVMNWHVLLRMFGEPHTFFDNYVQYALLAAYRNIPIPYFALAALAYSYKYRGTAYKTTGLVFVVFNVVYAVAGILVFALTTLFGLAVQPSWVTNGAMFASALAALALHPSILRHLIMLAGGRASTPSLHPSIGWKQSLALVLNCVLILVLGGVAMFFSASVVLDVPLALLPVCVGGWSLAVCLGCLLFWSPSDFGLKHVALLVAFQSSLPLPHAVVVFGTFRLIILALDLINASMAFLVWVFLDPANGQAVPPGTE